MDVIYGSYDNSTQNRIGCNRKVALKQVENEQQQPSTHDRRHGEGSERASEVLPAAAVARAMAVCGVTLERFESGGMTART